jgi:hypothetical protein
MAISMTGCGEGVVSSDSSTCRVELRVVNNRFFKLSLRSRDAFALLEPRIEAAIRSRIRRGAVQMTLDMTGAAAPASRRFDRGQLSAYLDDLEDFCATHRIPAPRTIDGILALPGILVETPPSSRAGRWWPGPSTPPSTDSRGCDGPKATRWLATCGTAAARSGNRLRQFVSVCRRFWRNTVHG